MIHFSPDIVEIKLFAISIDTAWRWNMFEEFTDLNIRKYVLLSLQVVFIW